MPKSQWPLILGNIKKLEDYALRPEALWVETVPWLRQQVFIDLDVREVLYGGAAGGGKSDALLRAFLRYAHVPGYAGLILRTDFQRLSLSGGLIPRSHEWFASAVADGRAKWNGGNYRWTLKCPGGGWSSLQFGYLSNSMDKFRYGSSEYQFIAFDELTEFSEEDYLFMFSRLRKTTDIRVPYRMRGASNPGGRGHEWVKARFVSEEAEHDLALGDLKLSYERDGRVFVPAKVRDNPAVDPVEYCRNLMHLDPVTRERLMNGDWTIMPTGLVRPQWFRYYSTQGRHIQFLETAPDGEGNVVHTDKVILAVDERESSRFMTVDAAGGVEDIRDEKKGKKLSWTACAVWDRFRVNGKPVLVLRHVERGRGLNYVAMRDMVRRTMERFTQEDRGMKTYVEDKAMGLALVADLGRGGKHVEPVSPGAKDKVARASEFLNMMEAGCVYLPRGENSWRPVYEGELLRWQGLDTDTNDQVDVSAYAGKIAGGFGGGVTRAAVDPRRPATDLVRDVAHSSGWSASHHEGGGFMAGWR